MNAAFRLAILLAVVLSLGAAARAPAVGDASCAVLVTIDTLRADHVSAYGYPRPTTPFLDSLARDGALFSHAYAPGSHTAPSHASLFTGWFPLQHRVRKNGQALPAKIGTLAQSMQAAGHDTAAASSVGWLRHLGRGFETFHSNSDPPTPTGLAKYHPANTIVDLGLAWLQDDARGDRRFLWLHFFDVHEWNATEEKPTTQEAQWSATAAMLDRRTPLDTPEFHQWLRSEHGTPPAAIERNWPAVSAAFSSYDARLRYVDRELERFATSMRAECSPERSIWIVTSDHGEGLFDHHYLGHGKHLFREQLHIPLIVHAPGRIRAGTRRDEIVRLVDIPPTLAALSGASWDQGEGVSFLPLLRSTDTDWPVRVNFAQRRPAGKKRLKQGWVEGEVFAIHDRDTKFIRRTEADDDFFRLAGDPHERLRRREDGVHDRWKDRADALWSALETRAPGAGSAGAVDPAMIDQLRALGYIVD